MAVPRVAIVDYGLGNLFSVMQACEKVGMRATVTSSREALLASDAAILPGVGAFGNAMAALHDLDLVETLRSLPGQNKLVIGICLGMQLLMDSSEEFGAHEGLGLIRGSVLRLPHLAAPDGRALKIPHVGWTRVRRPYTEGVGAWEDTPLAGLDDGAFMYFVHSFYAQPSDPSVVLALSSYGGVEFCSSLRGHNIFACQAHPERSGTHGLRVYHNLAAMLRRRHAA